MSPRLRPPAWDDRVWMVAGLDGGFLSQRGHPELARVTTRLDGNRLLLDCPGRSTLQVPLDVSTGAERSVTIWKDTCKGMTAGPAAAEWFSSLLETPCELVRQSDSGARQVDLRYAEPDDRVAFADGFPFLLISQASVDDLNSRLDEGVPVDRFRANIIVDGCAPHAEDGWSTVTIGEVDFRVAKPCARCVVITTDQLDGTRSAEPLRTLASYRTINGKVLFGQNLVHRGPGTLRVGDKVQPIHSG